MNEPSRTLATCRTYHHTHERVYNSNLRGGEGRRRGGKEKHLNNAQKFPKFDGKKQFTHSRNSRSPSRLHSKSSTPRHIIFKLLKAKDKERI